MSNSCPLEWLLLKINQHIEIVRTSIVGLSSMSETSCEAITQVLAKHYARVGVSTVNDPADLQNLVSSRPDLVFLGMKYITNDSALAMYDDKIWLTDYLDEHDIAYTGSGQKAHELELDKPKAKQHLLNAGLKTSAFYEILRDQPLKEENISLNYPLFIKPTNRGGGLGIDSDSVAHNFEQLQTKVRSLREDFRSDALVEEYLPGREFSVAILKDEVRAEYSTMPLELIAPLSDKGVRILSAQVKSEDSESFLRVDDSAIKLQINDLALRAFQVLGARDYGRIDIRLDASGTPQFLEANLIPSLIEGYGNFPKACLLNLGLDYESMILSIVKLGMARNISVEEIPYLLPVPVIA